MTAFQEQARNVLHWHSMAAKLHAAAKVIQREIQSDEKRLLDAQQSAGTIFSSHEIPAFQLVPAFGLLAAFALENLLKGILIQRTPALVLEHGLHKSLATHRLLPLARRAGFK